MHVPSFVMHAEGENRSRNRLEPTDPFAGLGSLQLIRYRHPKARESNPKALKRLSLFPLRTDIAHSANPARRIPAITPGSQVALGGKPKVVQIPKPLSQPPVNGMR